MKRAPVLVEPHGNVVLLRLASENPLNPLADELVDALGDALGRIDTDPSVHATVIIGSDKAFAAGADIAAIAARSGQVDGDANVPDRRVCFSAAGAGCGSRLEGRDTGTAGRRSPRYRQFNRKTFFTGADGDQGSGRSLIRVVVKRRASVRAAPLSRGLRIA